MPSPIAHASVGFLGVPALGDRPAGEARWRTWAVALLVVFACGAPDLDIIAGWLILNDPFTHHGAYSHSLLLAPAFGVLFALAVRWLRPGLPMGRAWAVGSVLYAAHVVMDALIYDTRGVAMLWPLVPDRFASPIVLFVGVEYSQWWRWDMHMLTLANEGAFAVLVLWVSRAIGRLRRPRGVAAHATG
jgi:predicted outer membrane lipoprotein